MSTPVIQNAAGRAAIEYRIGDFTSFRAAMLAAIPSADLLAGGVTTLQAAIGATDPVIQVLDGSAFPAAAPFQIKIDDEYLEVTNCLTLSEWSVTRGTAAAPHGVDAFVTLSPPNPFATWHEETADYQAAFVELWAYLADVLTFYQERIANEAFLGTATQRASLQRIAGLIGYRSGPGAGAEGWVAFTVAPNQSVTVPAGFRVGSRPQPGQPPVVFETGTSTTATADNNAIGLALQSPDVPFPPNSIVLQGVSTGLKAGDYLLIFDQGKAGTVANLVRVTATSAQSAQNFTIVRWTDVAGVYKHAGKSATVQAFSVTASPFGFNAPLWDVLSPTLTNSNLQFVNALYPASWEVRTRPDFIGVKAGPGVQNLVLNEWFFIPVPGERADQLFLDRSYNQLTYDAKNTGLAVLLTDDGVFQILTVLDARPASKTAYSVAAPSTRLTFDQAVTPVTFPLRGTTVLTGNRALPVQVDLPLPDPLTGSSLLLAGIHTQLQDGQTVLVRGKLFGSPNGANATETAVLDGPPQVDTASQTTRVRLKQPLSNQYVLATCTVMGNVAAVTQGETVADEVLGSGDGSEFQTFALKKSPLTYLPSTDAEGLSAVDSSLSVRVSGVEWQEVPFLAAAGAGDAVFVTSLDDDGVTTVSFGDGFNGARPSTGVDNIHARYRKGLGAAGNVSAGAVKQLVDTLPNLQKVENAQAMSGGADAEPSAGIRKNGPASLETFGRAVSASDYAALAESYPGISKASAAWVVQDPVTQQVASHPYLLLTAAAATHAPLRGTALASNLRRFLDRHRDPNVLLRIQDFQPVYLRVSVDVTVDARFPHQATLNAVSAALNAGANPDGTLGFFAFDRLQFGEPVLLSALYAAAQAVPGVDHVVVTELARSDATQDSGPADIVLGATEVAVIDQAAAPASHLVVTGTGGFAAS